MLDNSKLQQLQKLQSSLQLILLKAYLGGAGQIVYYDDDYKAMILGIHMPISGVVESVIRKHQEMVDKAWEAIPEELKAELSEQKLGFAVRLI